MLSKGVLPLIVVAGLSIAAAAEASDRGVEDGTATDHFFYFSAV